MRYLLVAALIAAGPAMAARYETDSMVARSGPDRIRLWDAPCVQPAITALVPPELREQLRKAMALVNGREFSACWIVDGDSVHLIYEDGDQGLIPTADFKPDRGA